MLHAMIDLVSKIITINTRLSVLAAEKCATILDNKNSIVAFANAHHGIAIEITADDPTTEKKTRARTRIIYYYRHREIIRGRAVYCVKYQGKNVLPSTSNAHTSLNNPFE